MNNASAYSEVVMRVLIQPFSDDNDVRVSDKSRQRPYQARQGPVAS